jgi:cullin-associated NEDD8-dissociated protein 1
MGYLQQLYSIGEASFVANIGPLFEPITDKGEFERGSKRTPPSLFAHNIQTSETQGVATGDSKAGGVLGRIGDALNSQAGKEIFDAYSISGTPKVLEGAPGVSRPADVLTEVGVATFTQTASEIETNIQEMNKYVANSIYGETFSDSISSAIARKNLLGGTIEESSLPQQTESCYANLERLETGIALQFKQVSRIIQQRDKLQAKRDVFYLQLGGFDAHGGDGYTGTANLLSEINDSLPCFVNDLKNQGLWNDVTIMSASEFGRTLTSNGQGTDHAWGGNHFLMGGAIAGAKIHGVYPDDLTDEGPLNIGRGRLIPTTSWEGVWKGVAEWFGVNNENMGTVLPNLENFQSNVFSKSDLYK